MSKFAAIDAAVRLELATENRPPPQTYQETMDKTYNYTNVTIRGFLQAVAMRLAADDPAYKFDWNSLDPNTAASDTVMVLEGAIATKTTG